MLLMLVLAVVLLAVAVMVSHSPGSPPTWAQHIPFVLALIALLLIIWGALRGGHAL